MAAILIEPPAGEPLSLSEAKNYLRVGHEADDALILSMIAAARLQVETRTRRALLTQSWRIVFDRWPATGTISSPVSPLREVLAARVKDETGEMQALDLDSFIANAASAPGMIAFDQGRVIHPARHAAGIEIDIEAGYGATSDFRHRLTLQAADEIEDGAGGVTRTWESLAGELRRLVSDKALARLDQ